MVRASQARRIPYVRTPRDWNTVDRVVGPIPNWWNWRLSAGCRTISVITLWLSLAFAATPGGMMLAVFVGRTVLSLLQTWLNIALGRKEPLAPARRMDFALTALTVAGVYFAAITNQFWGATISLPLLLPALVPLTVLQLLMARRAQRQHRTVQARALAMGRIVQFSRRSRAA